MTTNTDPQEQAERHRLQVEYRATSSLVPYVQNARTHSKGQVAEIAASIQAFGFTNPILIGEDGGVIAGHGRLQAAGKLGMTSVPVIVVSGLTDVQRRQLILADNRIALNAGWDTSLLRAELTSLKVLGADLKILGFTAAELSRALTGKIKGLTDEDDIPAPDDRPVAKPGDIWLLGQHRIVCGDSTSRETVAALLNGRIPHLMVTDPPYGVAYDPTWRHKAGVSKSARTGKVRNDERADWTAAWELFPGHIAYVWHGALHATEVAQSLTRTQFSIRSQIIWAKERLVIGRGDYHWQHEPCWYAVRTKGMWTGDRKQTTLWPISSKHQDTETVHSTQKPVECMRRPIINNSQIGDCIYEPFLGSGTTLIAAETVERVCLAVEIDPIYVDAAIKRWQAFAGKDAMLESTQQTFNATAVEQAQTKPEGAL